MKRFTRLRSQLILSHLVAIAFTLISMVAAMALAVGSWAASQPDPPIGPAQEARTVAQSIGGMVAGGAPGDEVDLVLRRIAGGELRLQGWPIPWMDGPAQGAGGQGSNGQGFDGIGPPGLALAYIVVVGPDGQPLASSEPGGAAFAPPERGEWRGLAQRALAGEQDMGRLLAVRSGGDPAGLGAYPILDDQGRPVAAVLVATDTLPQTTRGDSLWVILAIFGVGSVVVLAISSVFAILSAGAVGWLLSRRLARRLERLIGAARAFARGDMSRRVEEGPPDEVGQLEQSFNWMTGQLAENAAQRERLVEQQARREERARLEQELSTAQRIQHALLPKEVPALPGWLLIPYYRPAREVGGDFYDFLSFEDGRWGIVVGDATGKGVPAALVMAIARTMLRTASQSYASPGKVLERVNELLTADITPGTFVTCFFAVLDPSSGQLRYANAGHGPPFRKRDGRVAELRATGMPLGIMPGTRYDEGEDVLSSGESLLFYSDGVVEARNEGGEIFGFPRLASLLASRDERTPLVDVVLGELRSFAGHGWEQEDDVTLLALERLPDGHATPHRR
jgi:serine phosphatase RsbU (regulator of sigma subunit)